MKVGSLVYATWQGLGILCKSFYDHGVVTDPLVVRHGKHITHTEWYPGARVLGSLQVDTALIDWLKSLDVFMAFETPFIWPLFDIARQHKVKTALMVMHECLHCNVWQHKPDLFLCPSLLDLQVIDRGHDGCMQMFLPVPVEVPWRQRTRAEVFVHNAGHGGLRGRNGTKEFVDATRMAKSPAKFILRAQGPLDFPEKLVANLNVERHTCKTFDYNELWNDGDVFVFPEKFNGLSLPLQEARAAGMLVMCGDRFPMNTWLPRESLIPVASYLKDQRIGPPYQSFDEAVFDPKDIAATIDAWYGRDISEYSAQGKAWAESMSWAALKPTYMKVLEELCV